MAVMRRVPHLTMSGGTVGGSLFANDSSVVLMTGGFILGHAVISGSSTLTFSGGAIGLGIIRSVAGLVAPTETSAGGDRDSAFDAAHRLFALNAEDGLASDVFVHDNATLNIVGDHLQGVLIDPNYQGMFSLYQLSGTLADGMPMSGEYFGIQNGTGAAFLLRTVPEPETYALMLAGLGVLTLMVRHRMQ